MFQEQMQRRESVIDRLMCVAVDVNLFQSLDFMFHFNLPGLGIILRQTLALPRMLHLQLKQLQILQLPAQIIDQLQGGEH